MADRNEWLDLLTEIKDDEPKTESGPVRINLVKPSEDSESSSPIFGSAARKKETGSQISHESRFDSRELGVAGHRRPGPILMIIRLGSVNHGNQAPSATGRRKKAARRWLYAGVTLSIVLVGQLLHYRRDAIAAHPQYGNAISGFYSLFGSSLYPEWPLGAFEVRGTEAVAGRTSSKALDILAKVFVVGDEPVGMPLVRIVLRDRWSNPVASRIFHPVEYLADNYDQTRTAVPGTILPIEISVADPGTEARGYVVDICLPRRKAGLQCQLTKDPFR